jgi:hypothetical protein
MTIARAAQTLYTLQTSGGSLGLLDTFNRRVAMLQASMKLPRAAVIAQIEAAADQLGW